METLRTSDGFEFETTARDGVIRCICRRDGTQSEIIVEHGLRDEDMRHLVELFELGARNFWIAHRRAQARAEGRKPPRYDD
ncbi:MAG: hypothetical protein IT431_00975 [Phycisphaerales bacterium]|nr:hypothetical protein [Phycisphaerales bacterium]